MTDHEPVIQAPPFAQYCDRVRHWFTAGLLHGCTPARPRAAPGSFEISRTAFRCRPVRAARAAAGAAFLVKPTPPEDLIGLVQVAAEGHIVLSPAAARRLIVASADRQPARDRARHLAGSLTDREAQVLACLGEGLSNAQIAARLYLSEARVKGYVSRMLDKLGCANRAQAGLLAHDAPVSSARSPGRRSCRLELGLGARQAGLRPSPGRSCPPVAAGLTGPPRVGGCCDHVVDAVGDELL